MTIEFVEKENVASMHTFFYNFFLRVHQRFNSVCYQLVNYIYVITLYLQTVSYGDCTFTPDMVPA